MEHAQSLLQAPVGRALLAELIGLDLTARDRPGATIEAAVAAADLGQLAACQDRRLLLWALARVIEGGQAAAGPQLAAAAHLLGPIAEAVAAAPAARWWWEPVHRDAQRWIGSAGATLPRAEAVTDALRRNAATEAAEEKQERERRARRRRLWPPGPGQRGPISVTSWSPPLGGTIFTTTGPIDTLPATGLGCVEDSAGEERAEIWAVGIDPGARVREIDSADDWARLAAEFPRDVTVTRQYDWDEMTGRDGPWILPDWPALAAHADGIHLSVGGYLAATAIPAAAGTGLTLLTGWNPDESLWLNDVFTQAQHLLSWSGSPGSEAMPDISSLPWLPRPVDQD